jgi:peptide chain release factor subunit 1
MITLRQIDELMKISSARYPICSFYMGIVPVLLIQKKYRVLAKDIVKEGMKDLSRFSEEQREHIQKDSEKILKFVNYDFDEKSSGLAIFSSTGLGLWQVYPLPKRIKGRFVVDSDPYTRPLVRFFDENEKYFIVIVDRKKARLFSMYTGMLNERKEVYDEVQGRHKKGGWSQARFQRHIDNQAAKHFQNVSTVLYGIFKKEKFDHLIIGGPPEARMSFKNIIHSSLQRIVVNELERGIDEPLSEIQDSIRKVVTAFEDRQSGEYLKTLSDRLGKKQLAVSGLEDTVKMLQQARVHTLIVKEDLMLPGLKCGDCETPFMESMDTCSFCGKKVVKAPDIIDEIIEKTRELNGEVKFIKKSEELDKLGGIAALLRW